MSILSPAADFTTRDLYQVRSDYSPDLATSDSGPRTQTSSSAGTEPQFGSVLSRLLPKTTDQHADPDSDQKDQESSEDGRHLVLAVQHMHSVTPSRPFTCSLDFNFELSDQNGGVDCQAMCESSVIQVDRKAHPALANTRVRAADLHSPLELSATCGQLSEENHFSLLPPNQELSILFRPLTFLPGITPAPRSDPKGNVDSRTAGLSILAMQPEIDPTDEGSIVPVAPTSKDAPDIDRFSLPESNWTGQQLSPDVDSKVVFTGRLVPQTISETAPTPKPQAPAGEQVANSAGSTRMQPMPDGPHTREFERDLHARRAEPAIAFSASSRDANPGVGRQTPERAQSAPAQRGEIVDASVDRESAGIVREISMRVGGQAQESAHLRVVERGGEVLVSVRTGSEQLARTLNGDLGDLALRLEQTGFRTELWRPVAQTSSSESSHDRRGDSSNSGDGNQALPWDRGDSREHPGRKSREWVDDPDEQ